MASGFRRTRISITLIRLRLGNPNLKPESAWSGDGGVNWVPSTRLSLSVTGFYSRQHDAIDYVRVNATQKWQAVNLSGLRFAG